MTWFRHSEAYEIFFNRDEKKTRQKATPPLLQELQGVRFLAPRDEEAGGSWMLANEHGVALTLLNLWGVGELNTTQKRSRGRMLTDELADVATAQEALTRLHDMDLRPYPGFTLAAFDLQQTSAPLMAQWDGAKLLPIVAQMPLCSSGFSPREVLTSRQNLFDAAPHATPHELWLWHTQEPQPTAYTVRMNRPDAQTWSISHVSISSQNIQWRYLEESLNLALPPTEHTASMAR